MVARPGGRSAHLLGAVVFFLSVPAMADDAPFNWTGFYAGVHLGGLADLSEVSDPLGRSLFGNPIHASGAFGGAQAGYTYQSGIVVYGLDADVSFPRVEGTGTCSALSGSFVNANCVTDIDAFGTLAARLGLALGASGRTVIYGKAGAAWYAGGLDQATNDMTEGAAGNTFTVRSDDRSRWGWTLGFGADYALSRSWFLNAEYGYAKFGNRSVGLLPSAVLDSTGAVVETIPGRRGQISNDLHTFKLGLNYRFGSSSGQGDEAAPVPQFGDPTPANHGYGLEIGARYWYSWGRHKYDLGLLKNEPASRHALVSRLTYDDVTASTGEVTGRLTTPWNVFAAGFIGGGSITGGHMNDEDYNIPGDTVASIPYSNTLSPKLSGDIPAYGTIDVGYDWWRAPGHRLGAYVGYNYYRETMGALGVIQIANQLGPVGADVGGGLPPIGHPIIAQEATWQSLRLGATGAFQLTPRFTLSADVAFLPYVSVDAEDRHYFGNTPEIASINPLRGHGYGTQMEAMLVYAMTDRLNVGVGARYWSMWTKDGHMQRIYDAGGPVLPIRQHLKIETERVGVFGQVSYRFGD
ncbi:porin [Hyphomicrobium nitrativorans NL23]|uniref:Porin n=1 Tax=Hyphomicrobium nitrativorans NL23 TaxID=1029756 RepID=V5SCH6_9HYPH|nr:outer membrane beta-barrel protein [Hyphomicrobium nitrativorans]AHB48192.1 porin [Hyphomicrobium nitrativorans NL23]